jgi:hypothetical protein
MYDLSAEDRLLLATHERMRDIHQASRERMVRHRAPNGIRAAWARVARELDTLRPRRSTTADAQPARVGSLGEAVVMPQPPGGGAAIGEGAGRSRRR